MELRIVSWNVNGIRSALRKGFADWLRETKPDIVCLQEVRAMPKDLAPLETHFPDHRAIWHPATRPGYSGTGILTRFEPLGIERGLHGAPDDEGRAITADFGVFRVASLYAPNAAPFSPKIPIKSAWLDKLREHVASRSDAPFVVCGDINVAHRACDSQGVSQPQGMNGCTQEERAGFQTLLDDCQLVDFVRESSGDEVLSSWWFPTDVRRRGQDGLRLDYALVAEEHRAIVRASAIHADTFGSDHCPVSIVIDVPEQGLRPYRRITQQGLF